MPAQHRPELEDILSEKLLAVEAMGDRRIDDDTEIIEEALPGFCVECKDQEVNGSQTSTSYAYICLINHYVKASVHCQQCNEDFCEVCHGKNPEVLEITCVLSTLP